MKLSILSEIIDPSAIPISKLNLDQKSMNVLPDWGVRHVGDLMNVGVEGLQSMRNMSRASIKLIGKRLAALNLQLPGYNEFLRDDDVSGNGEIGRCRSRSCAGDGIVRGLRDLVSQKEYEITGLCQTCQDEVFNGEEW